VNIASIVVTLAPGVTDWLTGVGTVAVAVVAVGAALYAERRADRRVVDERRHAATVLVEERKAADERLLRQMEHSDAQLRQERQQAQEAEQRAQAWAVEVLPGKASDRQDASSISVLVGNLGIRTITRVEAKFSPDGKQLVAPKRSERVRPQSGPVTVTFNPVFVPPDGKFSAAYSGVLTPGHHIRFWSSEIADEFLSVPYPVVRWSDWLGQRWEHKKGDVQPIDDNTPWTS
jgi:hypothetical protein